MNRVLGDYFETLLYKIFVSIDEHTSVAEVCNSNTVVFFLIDNNIDKLQIHAALN
jgi:hypothetical protein